MNFRKVILPLLILFLLTDATYAQHGPEVIVPINRAPLSTMYVGSSFFYFNNGMPTYVSRLGEGMPSPDKLSGTLVTISGAGLDWHTLDIYLRPNGIGIYSFDKDNNIVFNKRAKFFDSVVMMDCSQCPIHPQLSSVFEKSVRENAEISRKHDVEPILFMTWAYQDRPEMTDKLADAYTRVGNINKMLVIPAGLAFARVTKERPNLSIYQSDKRHPTILGTYLAAATTYSALTGRSSEDSTYTSEIDPEVAKYLRVTAWQVAQDYYGSNQIAAAGSAKK